MSKKLFILALLVPFAFLFVGLLLPSTYAVERSTTIAATPQAIHALVGDLRKWPEWSAWNSTDVPGLELGYEGDPTAVGGAQVLKENPGTGESRIVITATDAAKGLSYEIRTPGAALDSQGSLAYAPDGAGTRVVWRNGGRLGWNPVVRLVALKADATLGPQLERGLQRLKQQLEQGK